MNIELKNFCLVNLYRSNPEILSYLKRLNQDSIITEYLPDLSIYIGKKNAYFIQENGDFIGFLSLASTLKEKEKELFFAIDREHRAQHKISQVLKELIPYIFQNTEIEKLWITPMNPKSKRIAIENHFQSIDDFHYYQKNDDFLQNKNSM